MFFQLLKRYLCGVGKGRGCREYKERHGGNLVHLQLVKILHPFRPFHRIKERKRPHLFLCMGVSVGQRKEWSVFFSVRASVKFTQVITDC